MKSTEIFFELFCSSLSYKCDSFKFSKIGGGQQFNLYLQNLTIFHDLENNI